METHSGSIRSDSYRFAFSRLAVGVGLMAVVHLVILLWFLIGQGYDRTTARLVLQVSVLLIPIGGLVLYFNAAFRDAMERVFGPRERLAAGFLPMSAYLTGLVLVGIVLPALVVFMLLDPTGPFEELWVVMGSVTVVFGGFIYFILKPVSHRALFALAFLIANAGILLGYRAFLFSFF